MEYRDTYTSWEEYIKRCQSIINNSQYNSADAFLLNPNIVANKSNSEINTIIKEHRNNMIKTKIDHTLRMIDQIIKVNEKLELKTNLALVIKVAVLYHDIGRFRQATWCNTFSDFVYREYVTPFHNHGEDGCDIFLHEDFKVSSKYIPIIAESILHHLDHAYVPKLNYRYNDVRSINVDDIATGNFWLNEGEWQIASLITGLVADVDKIDILYQHLDDGFEMIRDWVYDNSLQSLDNVAAYWGITKKEIIEYNNIDENNYVPRIIRVPIKNIELSKLEVPKHMKEMFYNNNWAPLKELQRDLKWNFISILWWHLSEFLNQISFTSVLNTVNDYDLLPKIYAKIPNNLKSLFTEAFNYAQEKLVNDQLKNNENNIYLKK
jgi:hypothetical protein